MEAAINTLATPFSALSEPVQPRAKGDVCLSGKMEAGKNRIGNLRQSGSLKLLFPRVPSDDLQAITVNTAGGVTGGDSFSLRATAEAGSRLTLSTQAAERAYKAQPGQTGQIVNSLCVEDAAHLNWLPQETILFDGCAINRKLSVELTKTARLLLAEPLVFGRAASHEQLTSAAFKDRIEVTRCGKLHFLDAISLKGDISAQLAKPTIGNGAGAMASVLYIAPDAEAHLDTIRALLPESGGASLIHEDTLFVRALAPDSFELRRFLVPILNRLSGNSLPRPWMI